MPFGSPAVLGFFVAGEPSRRKASIRNFPSPAFVGFGFVGTVLCVTESRRVSQYPFGQSSGIPEGAERGSGYWGRRSDSPFLDLRLEEVTVSPPRSRLRYHLLRSLSPAFRRDLGPPPASSRQCEACNSLRNPDPRRPDYRPPERRTLEKDCRSHPRTRSANYRRRFLPRGSPLPRRLRSRP